MCKLDDNLFLMIAHAPLSFNPILSLFWILSNEIETTGMVNIGRFTFFRKIRVKYTLLLRAEKS